MHLKLLMPLALVIVSVLNSVALAQEGGNTPSSDAKQFIADKQFVRKLARDLLHTVKVAQPEAGEFSGTCEAIITVLKQGKTDAEKFITDNQDNAVNADALHKTVQGNINNEINKTTSGNFLAMQAWANSYAQLRAELEKPGRFRSDSVAAWRDLYAMAIEIFEIAQTGDIDKLTAEIGDGPVTINSAQEFLASNFAERVYPRLLALGVVKADDSFPETCRKLGQAIQKVLDTQDASGTVTTGPELLGRAVAGIIEVLDEQTKGDPDAKTAWANALDEFLGELQKSEGQRRFDKNNIQHVRHALTVLKSALVGAVEADKKFVAQLNSNRAGGSSSQQAAGSARSYGTSHAAVHHARTMVRIYRGHERRSYRIEAIQAR